MFGTTARTMIVTRLLILSLGLWSIDALDANDRKRIRPSSFGIAGRNASYDYVGKSSLAFFRWNFY